MCKLKISFEMYFNHVKHVSSKQNEKKKTSNYIIDKRIISLCHLALLSIVLRFYNSDKLLCPIFSLK